MAGHAGYRITPDMYVGTTADVLDRARAATRNQAPAPLRKAVPLPARPACFHVGSAG